MLHQHGRRGPACKGECSMKLSFTKMQGCANDYIYLDCRASGVPADIAALAQRLSARRFSVGADGII